MYQPHRFTHWTLGLDKVPGWKDEVKEQMSHPVAWSKRWRKPLLLSEWGAWVPPCHSVEDYKTHIRFVADECEKHDIGWIYYCAGFNNQWAFNILHTEDGWNQDALDILTGVTAPPPAPMSPLINTEFGWSTANWIGEGSARISVARNAGLSGPTALKVEATKSDRAEVYQETPKRRGSPPGRHLISVRKGRLYKISFLAKSADGTGTVQVRLANVSGSSDGFWTSTPVERARRWLLPLHLRFPRSFPATYSARRQNSERETSTRLGLGDRQGVRRRDRNSRLRLLHARA